MTEHGANKIEPGTNALVSAGFELRTGLGHSSLVLGSRFTLEA